MIDQNLKAAFTLQLLFGDPLLCCFQFGARLKRMNTRRPSAIVAPGDGLVLAIVIESVNPKR